MNDKQTRCWLHPEKPVVGCPSCPPPTHVCVGHGPFYGATTECPRCKVDMKRHKTRARNALIEQLRSIKKAKEPMPDLLRCAVARAGQMREVVESLGVGIDVVPVENFPWEKFQLLRK